jgi:hypothetical protein
MPPRGLQEHLAKLPPRYALSVDARDVLVHMRLLAEARSTGSVTAHAEPAPAHAGQHSSVRRTRVSVVIVTIFCRRLGAGLSDVGGTAGRAAVGGDAVLR